MILSAVNPLLSGLPGALHLDGEMFREMYGFWKPALDQEVVFYCRSGMRSSTGRREKEGNPRSFPGPLLFARVVWA
jgi:hypothetical protein